MKARDAILDPRWTLVEHRAKGLSLDAAIAARAFGLFLQRREDGDGIPMELADALYASSEASDREYLEHLVPDELRAEESVAYGRGVDKGGTS